MYSLIDATDSGTTRLDKAISLSSGTKALSRLNVQSEVARVLSRSAPLQGQPFGFVQTYRTFAIAFQLQFILLAGYLFFLVLLQVYLVLMAHPGKPS